MPSGISEEGLTVEVADEGRVLEISNVSPKAMTEVDLLHNKLRKPNSENLLDYNHPKFGAFDDQLPKRRDPQSRKVHASTLIRFPFLVQAEFDHDNLAWHDNSAFVAVVDWRAVEPSTKVSTIKPFVPH